MIQKLYLKDNHNNSNAKEKENNKKDIIRTTATIKKTNYSQLNIYAQKFNIPKYQLAILCMEYFIKQNHYNLKQKSGTIKYNEADDYTTLGLIYENEDKFELFRSLRTINQYSVSFLMDTAIQMYLHTVVKMLLNKIKQEKKIILDEILDDLILSINPISIQLDVKAKKSHFVSFLYKFCVT